MNKVYINLIHQQKTRSLKPSVTLYRSVVIKYNALNWRLSLHFFLFYFLKNILSNLPM